MKIKNYKLKQEIGKGGMATVYLGEHISLKRAAALKIMSTEIATNEQFQQSFLKEGEIVAQLEHPNIVGIYDIGKVEDGSTFYMAMEYLRGGSLKDKLAPIEGEHKALAYQECVDILSQVGTGLEHAHQHDFVHRDIKPANILFRQDGTAVLTDFGIAKLQDSVGDLTRLGYTLGTLQYMSPEQASTTEQDQRSDIYSLGLVFYEMLTGQKAYQADTTAQAIYQHVNEPPPQLEAKYAYLQAVMDKALAKDPDKRFSSVSNFIAAVKNADPNTDSAHDKTIVYNASTASAASNTVSSRTTSPSQARDTNNLIDQKNNTAFAKKPLLISAAVGVLVLLALAFLMPSFWGTDTNIAETTTPLNAFDPLASNPQDTLNASNPELIGEVNNIASNEIEKVNMILDASGSMWAKINGVEKINIAREVIKKTVDSWDDQKALGLMVYGHRVKGDCNDIEQLLPVNGVDKIQFYQAIDTISPKGKTPIAASLKMAANELKYTEDKASVILITDGEESCSQDPCQTAQELEKLGVDFKAHVIGFDIKDEKVKQQLRCIADSTGGEYQEANSQSQLDQALEQISHAEPENNVNNSHSVDNNSNNTEPEKPQTGLLKLSAISQTSGKPVKADFIVKRLDQSSLRTEKNPTLWAKSLLNFIIPPALAEKIFVMQAGKKEVRVKNVYRASFELAIGQYHVTVRRNGAETRKKIVISANQTQRTTFPFKPIELYANIELKSINADTGKILQARYSIKELNSGNQVATNEQLRGRLKKGQYQISAMYRNKLKKGQYQISALYNDIEQSKNIDIVTADTVKTVFKFKIKAEPEPVTKGKLQFKAINKQTGAALKVKFTLIRSRDTKVLAVYEAAQSAEQELLAGKYQIKADYESIKLEKMVDLSAGQIQRLVFEISPEKPPVVIKQGELLLSASDADTKKPLKIDFKVLNQSDELIAEQKNTSTAQFTLPINETYTIVAHNPADKENDQSETVEIKTDKTTERHFLIQPAISKPIDDDVSISKTEVIISAINLKTRNAVKVNMIIKDLQKKMIVEKENSALTHVNLSPNQYEITVSSPKEKWKPITKMVQIKAQKKQNVVFLIPFTPILVPPLPTLPIKSNTATPRPSENPIKAVVPIELKTNKKVTPEKETSIENNPIEAVLTTEEDNFANSAVNSAIKLEKPSANSIAVQPLMPLIKSTAKGE